MYDLFVLGELMSGSKHGYQLQDILKRAAGRYRQISSGTLYPLIARLAESGWIRQQEEEPSGGRQRKIYELTEAGRERFRQLMEQPLEYNSDTELMFHFKMVYFQYVTKDVRLSSLEQYLAYLRLNLSHVTEFESQLIAARSKPEKVRYQLLRIMEHRRHVGAADIRWVTEEIKRIEAGGDPPFEES